jgi:hypothetical protein
MEEPDVLGGEGMGPFGWRVDVVPSLQKFGDGRFNEVWVVMDVKRAWPEITFECLSQVADGFAYTPAK